MNLEESVRQTKEQWSADPQLKIEREQVIDKYSEIFKLDNIDKLTPEIFKKFLRRDENKHWSKLDRVGGNLVKNMPKLKSGLKILLDESIPLPERIKRIRDKTSVDYTPNLANAIYTPILLITNPKKYPVVNLVVVEALDELGMYSKKDWTTNEEEWDSIPQMQQIVMETALKHDLDLWQIDWAWWRISRNDDTPNSKSVNADVDFWLVG